MIEQGTVIKAVAGAYTVRLPGGDSVCSVRGRIKKDFDIFVGDKVETEDNVIINVLPRKNVLIRPYVSNVDFLFIVLACVPEPDFVLVEKLLLNCRKEGIGTAIVFNKCDLADKNQARALLEPYKNDAELFFVSAKTGEGKEELLSFIQGKTVCFAGQSAVGKTSLISLLAEKELLTGELSRKIKRGKNTTRTVEIHEISGGFVVDTCGFSVAESIDIKPDDLVYYYDEFVKVQSLCRYGNCKHINEPGCKVKEMLANGEFDKNRYNRYIKLYTQLTERRKKLYD